MRRDLGRLAGREHDVLVVGGGIYGAAALWEAAHRGLTAVLVEKADFACGTTWNSLKTIHGGLRHLQRADLGSLRESVRERRALLRVAPDLVRPLAFVVPAYGHGRRGREALAAGLFLNDILSADRNRGLRDDRRLPRGRVLSRREVLDLVPGTPERGLTGGVVWTDAQVESPDRLVLALLEAADAAGAAVANYAEATGLLVSGGRVSGARVRDVETGQPLEVRARVVVNASGPEAGILAGTGLAEAGRPVPLLSALNLVLRRPVVSAHAVGALAEGRYLFLVPWRDRALAGTAYWPPASGPAGAARVRELVAAFAAAFPWSGITGEDVALVHRGLVPGERDAAGLWTRGRVVDHRASGGPAGLLSLVGVKLTTARAMAEAAVDLAFRRLGRPPAPSRSATTPLPGARPPAATLSARASAAAREEMALHLTDAVLRRLDLGDAGRPSDADVAAVLEAMATELGWDPSRRARELEALALTYSALSPAGGG